MLGKRFYWRHQMSCKAWANFSMKNFPSQNVTICPDETCWPRFTGQGTIGFPSSRKLLSTGVGNRVAFYPDQCFLTKWRMCSFIWSPRSIACSPLSKPHHHHHRGRRAGVYNESRGRFCAPSISNSEQPWTELIVLSTIVLASLSFLEPRFSTISPLFWMFFRLSCRILLCCLVCEDWLTSRLSPSYLQCLTTVIP